MIRLSCPHCGTPFKAPDDAAGQTGRCRRCQQSFQVPLLAVAEQSPGPIVEVRRGRGQEYEGGPSGAPYSLAIGAMVLGAVSFPVSVIPFLGVASLFISGPGVVLAILSVLVMIWNRGRGIGFVAAGCVLCAVAFGLGCRQYRAVERLLPQLEENHQRKGQDRAPRWP